MLLERITDIPTTSHGFVEPTKISFNPMVKVQHETILRYQTDTDSILKYVDITLDPIIDNKIKTNFRTKR